MRLLLDSHVFLWCTSNGRRLSAAARELLGDASNERSLSVATVWELAIKASLGKLRLPTDLRTLIAEQSANLQLSPLAMTIEHALGVATLPLHHRDPFDRMPVAQARAEGLVLLTSDRRIRDLYEVETAW